MNKGLKIGIIIGIGILVLAVLALAIWLIIMILTKSSKESFAAVDIYQDENGYINNFIDKTLGFV